VLTVPAEAGMNAYAGEIEMETDPLDDTIMMAALALREASAWLTAVSATAGFAGTVAGAR
jgi:hypothetical protein